MRDTLRELYPNLHEDDIKSQTMGMSGEDIVLSPAARKKIPYSIECKNVEKLNIWSALQQAEDNANNMTPAVIFKRNHSNTYVTIPFDHFMELIKND